MKQGSERIAAMALMNKIIAYTKRGTPLSILSATYLENIDQHIYVEAYKLENVREAINGLAYCFMKIDILPLDEMTKIYQNSDN